MKKFLLVLAAVFVSAAWFAPASAYWTESEERLLPADITAGQTIAIQAASGVSLTGWLGSWELVDAYIDDCLWVVEDAGTNQYVNRSQFYFKQKTTGKYLGYNANEGHLVSSVDDAYKLTIWPSQPSTDDDGNVNATEQRFAASGNSRWDHSWDENSVTIAINVSSSYMTSMPTMLANSPDFSSNPATNSQYTSCRGWNLYSVTEGTDPIEEIGTWVEYYNAKGYTRNTYVGGTNPGYFEQAAAEKYQAAYDALTGALESTTLTLTEAKTLVSNFQAAIANVDSQVVPITDGYYYVVSSANQFAADSLSYGMYSSNATGAAGGVYWDTLNVKDPTFVYYITKRSDGYYNVQNLRYSLYWNSLGALPAQVDNVTETANGQRFASAGTAGQWNIFSRRSGYTSYYYYPADYSSAYEGQISYTSSKGTDNSRSWTLIPLTDQTLLDSLKQAVYDATVNENLYDAAQAAQATLNETAYVYDPDLTTPLIPYTSSYSDDVSDRLIVSSVDEITPSNCGAAMIDNNSSTYWHTQWAKQNLNKHPKYNWVVAKLAEPVQQFVVRLIPRQGNWNNWATQVYIYGSDTEPDEAGNADWVKEAEIALPDIRSYSTTAEKNATRVTSAIQLSKPYKYLKYYGAKTNNGSASNGLVAMCYAEFNYFPCTLNTDKSASVRDDMKEPIATLEAAIAEAVAKSKAGTGTQADVDAIKAAEKAYLAQYPDPSQLISEIKAAQLVVERAVADDGETYGTVSEEAVQALENKILATVEDPSDDASYDKLYKLTRAEMDALYNEFVALENAVAASARSVKDGGIYYIKNNGEPSYDENHVTKNAIVYTRGHDTGSGLYWGYSVAEYEQNADAWWQAIKTSDSTFAFRNVASGWYIGENTSSSSLFTLADTAVSYKVEYIGGASFSLTPVVAAGKTAYMMYAQQNGYKVVGWNSTVIYNNACAWTFEEVEFEGALNIQPYQNNSVQIVTLPYNTSEPPTSDAADITCYQLVGVEADSEGNVSKIKVEPIGNEIAAGTPFIMVVGDTTQYKSTDLASTDTISVDMHIDSENSLVLSTDIKNVNGLIGAPEAKALKAAGYGYFDGRNLVATTESSKTIAAQSGYIDVASVEDKTAEAVDILEISVAGDGVLNAIKEAIINGNDTVDVYTIDGVLVKKSVKASAATSSLSKGIYIIGKKKVLVK